VTAPTTEVQKQPSLRQASEVDGGKTTSAAAATTWRRRSGVLDLTFPTAVRFHSKRSIFEVMQTRNSSASSRPLRLRESRGVGSTLALLPLIRTRRHAERSVQSAGAIFPVTILRSDELIWRRTGQTISDVVKRVQQIEALQADEASSMRSTSVRPEIMPTVSATATAPASVTELDPSLVDRLADHVIRKVDKRMRIERERRGL